MSEIPEEIRKMFPDQPIHKMDIVDGELQILASSEPLSNEPDFEKMPIEQVNQYLRDHGYDPEQVKLNGKILVDALIENINLKTRAEAAERELAALREQTRWIPVSERVPHLDGYYLAYGEGWAAEPSIIYFYANSGDSLDCTHWKPLDPPEGANE